MFWFKKKEPLVSKDSGSEDEGSEEGAENKPAISGNVEVELTKIKSSLEALNEIRKANAEQFTRISEQIGELRAALMDSNKAISVIEVASTRAIDMVNSVQPDKLMIEVRKEDGKVEALRANIEANETIMRDIMKEMKSMREQMNFYKGVDQVVKMNNEIKNEIVEIKKTEGIVGKHADRVETIFVEVEKKFYDFEKFSEAVKELDRTIKKISTDFDKARVNIDEKADKREFVKLVDKFSDFEKHTTNILKLLDQKSKYTTSDLNNLFEQLKKQLEKKYSTKLDVKGLGAEEKIDVSAPVVPSAPAASNDIKADAEKKNNSDTNASAGSKSDADSQNPQSNTTAASEIAATTDQKSASDNSAIKATPASADTTNVGQTKSESKGFFGFLRKK